MTANCGMDKKVAQELLGECGTDTVVLPGVNMKAKSHFSIGQQLMFFTSATTVLQLE